MRLWLAVFVVALAIWTAPAAAHEVRPAFLSATEQQPGQWDIVWKQPVLEGKRLRLNPQLSSEGGTTCEWAAATRENLPDTTIERGQVECAMAGVTIEGLDRTLTDVIVEIRALDAAPVTALLRPDVPSLDLSDAPQSPASAYLRLGVEHILTGWDHLLFVIGLVLLIGGKRRLLGVVTAFTLAHSLTLGLAAMGLIGIPARPVEILIAASIVLLAVEILRKRSGRPSIITNQPYLIAIVIGLVHGLGFAGALSETGLPQGTELLALLMFNLGVEIGQIGVIAATLLLLAAATLVPHLRDKSEVCAAYVIGGIGMFWVIDRLGSYFA